MTDDLETFFADNRDAINKAAMEAVISRVKERLQWNTPNVVQAEVNRFMEEEIAPEVAKMLLATKGEILKSVAAATAEIGDELRKAMVLKATENLTGYRAKDVITALMK